MLPDQQQSNIRKFLDIYKQSNFAKICDKREEGGI